MLNAFLERNTDAAGKKLTHVKVAALAGVQPDYLRKWLACYERSEAGQSPFTTKAGTPRSDRVVALLTATDLTPFETSLTRKKKRP
jgi:hypothetical protein